MEDRKIEKIDDAVLTALDYKRTLEMAWKFEQMIVGYMIQSGIEKITAGDVVIEYKEGRLSFDHKGAAMAAMADMLEDEVKAILAKATPEPKVSWSRVTGILGIDRASMQSQRGDPSVEFKIAGKRTGKVEVASDYLPF